MQCRSTDPTHSDAGMLDGIGGQPEVANRDQVVSSVDQRKTITHPGHDTFFLK